MIQLSSEQAVDFFRRCYNAVDGLWFMKVEEKYEFETALKADDEVWKVFPKIQARKLKEPAGLGNGIDSLRECLDTKLGLEGYSYQLEALGSGDFRVTISQCPWLGTMLRSGREELSAQVGRAICSTEYAVWASEFGDNIQAEQECRICEGAETCIMQFTRWRRPNLPQSRPLSGPSP